MKRETAVKDIKTGSLNVMIIQRKKKAKKDGWLFYPVLLSSTAVALTVGFSGNLFTPAGRAIGTACLVVWAILAIANTKTARWGTRRLSK